MKVKFNIGRKNTHLRPFKIAHTEPNSTEQLSNHLLHYLLNVSDSREVVVICVGTDRSTGDSLGPLVGTQLQKHITNQLHIYGTLKDPVHALNLNDTLSFVMNQHNNPYIIAIDACLGQLSSVGCIQIGNGPVKPGAGVNKDLPPVGHIHITGIVNIGGFMEYFVLQNTRLSLVIQLAEIIADAIISSYSKAYKSNPVDFRSTPSMSYVKLD